MTSVTTKEVGGGGAGDHKNCRTMWKGTGEEEEEMGWLGDCMYTDSVEH